MLWAPLDEANFHDPYPMYKRLRKEAPIYKSQTGEWIFTRYDDILEVLKDKRFLSGSKKDWVEKGIEYFDNKEKDFRSIGDAIDSFLLFINPPRHTVLRKVVAKAWNNREVEEIISNNISSLLSDANKDFDIVKGYAQPLPAMTIAHIMGIPIKDYEVLRSKGNELLKVLDLYISLKELVEVNRAASFFVKYFQNEIERKQNDPKEDLISKIILESNRSGANLSIEEITSLCIFLFLAGEETTVSLIGNGLLNLSENKSQLELLTSGKVEWKQGVEELLRYDSPVHIVGRIASENMLFKNSEIKKGEICTLCLASANRDEDKIEEPEKLNVKRSPNRHLAFGSGIHFCLGDWLAKKQGELAIKAFIERFEDYDIDKSSLILNKNLSIRSYLQMRVVR